MHVIEQGGNNFQIASDVFKLADQEALIKRYRKYAYRFLIKTVQGVTTEQQRVLNLVAQTLGHATPYAFLEAHGGLVNGIWKYWDGPKTFPVQDWVNQHDGRFQTLLILSCNPGGKKLRAQHSAVVYPENTIRPAFHAYGISKVQAFIPGMGTLTQRGW